jgi:hypothetical protein
MTRVRILVPLFLLLSSVPAFAAERRSGVWSGEIKGDRVQLQIMHKRNEASTSLDSYGFSVPIAELKLPAAALAGRADVVFSITRDAGTIAFDGHFGDRNGAGSYRFTPRDEYTGALRSLSYDDVSDDDLLLFTVQNLTIANVRGLIAMNRKPAPRELEEVAIFEVTPQMLREFAATGYDRLTIGQAVDFRIGRVTPRMVDEMRALGYSDLSAEKLADLAIMGATPEYIRSMRAAGLSSLTPSEATDLRIGRITPETIAAFRRLGYRDLTAQQLSELGIRRIDPAYVERLRTRGYHDLSVDQLLKLKTLDEVADRRRR